MHDFMLREALVRKLDQAEVAAERKRAADAAAKAAEERVKAKLREPR